MRSLKHLLWAALLAAGTSHAAVSTVIASPMMAHTALTTATSINVGWSVTSTAGGNVSSPQGVFRTSSGETLGTVNQALNKSLSGAGVATFSETVMVPTDVAYRAHKMGFSSLQYERSFNDGGGASNGAVTLYITTSASAGFGISRIALVFDDGEALRIVNKGTKLKAVAELSYTGTGMARGHWEIAGPNPDGQKPQWRSLGAVAQGLMSETSKIVSPALPTNSTGSYLVRLRITDPAFAFETPIIHYSVIAKKK